MLDLLSYLGMRNEYVEPNSKGEITITYRLRDSQLNVEADFQQLDIAGPCTVVFANEQSGKLFSQKVDYRGAGLQGTEIEPW